MVIKTINKPEPEGISLLPLPELANPSEDCGAVEIDQCRPVGVLVIEDERLMLKALEQGLRRRGFVVWAAPDGGEGVDLYRRFGARIDVVLSDVQMPVLNGPKTLDALREINPSVRFCFMTGDTRASTLTKLLRLGALRVFPKPLPSVAVVAEELWELATCPNDFSGSRELGGDDAAGPASEAALIQSDEKLVDDGFFGRAFSLLRSVTGIGLLPAKAQTQSAGSLPPA